MADLWQILLQNLGGRLDAELLPRLYDTLGVSASDVRAELRELGLPFLDPVTGSTPSMGELDASADAVMARASRTTAGSATSARRQLQR